MPIILSEQKIIQSVSSGMQTSRYISELNNAALLPLLSHNHKLPIIARIIGALFSDGNMYSGKNNYREINFTLGQKDDVIELSKDLDLLGFKYHSSERTNIRRIGTRKFQMHTWKVKCCSTALWLLLKSLGVPAGNKTKQSYNIPDWIMTSAKEIKKEFLKGYLGGDGPKVTVFLAERKKKQPYNKININDIEFYKEARYRKSGIEFAKQLKELLNEFGIKVNKIFSKQIIIAEKNKSIIHIAISSSLESAYSYSKVGFAYCNQKTTATLPVLQFLKVLFQKRQMWEENHKKALNLYNMQNKSIKEISTILGVSKDTLYGWIRLCKRPTVGYHKIKYPVWLDRGVKNDC